MHGDQEQPPTRRVLQPHRLPTSHKTQKGTNRAWAGTNRANRRDESATGWDESAARAGRLPQPLERLRHVERRRGRDVGCRLHSHGPGRDDDELHRSLAVMQHRDGRRRPHAQVLDHRGQPLTLAVGLVCLGNGQTEPADGLTREPNQPRHPTASGEIDTTQHHHFRPPRAAVFNRRQHRCQNARGQSSGRAGMADAGAGQSLPGKQLHGGRQSQPPLGSVPHTSATASPTPCFTSQSFFDVLLFSPSLRF